MAAESARERRPAIWPWLVMPLVVLLVFLTLHTVHRESRGNSPNTAVTPGPPPQE